MIVLCARGCRALVRREHCAESACCRAEMLTQIPVLSAECEFYAPTPTQHLPVCVGCGPTKTLAKLANHLAKKNAVFNGVCDLHALTRTERQQWMSKIEVGQVWGLGKRISTRIQEMGIHTVLDLRNASPKEIRTQFVVKMERTCNELRGISCLELEDIAPAKKQIMSSRSFGAPVESIEELGEAISTYVARAGEKLRQQESVAAAVHVFIKTNRFSENEKQLLQPIQI